jgi:hypothetical protein
VDDADLHVGDAAAGVLGRPADDDERVPLRPRDLSDGGVLSAFFFGVVFGVVVGGVVLGVVVGGGGVPPPPPPPPAGVGVSSSRMSPNAAVCAGSVAAPVGFVRSTSKRFVGSIVVLPWTCTVTVRLTTPAGNVTVPFAAS